MFPPDTNLSRMCPIDVSRRMFNSARTTPNPRRPSRRVANGVLTRQRLRSRPRTYDYPGYIREQLILYE